MTALKYPNLLVTYPLTDSLLHRLQEKFTHVEYLDTQDASPGKDVLRDADIWLSGYKGPPKDLQLADVPRLRVFQLSSAGANAALDSPFFKDKKAQEQIAICNGSGVHVYTIPQYIIGMIVNLYMNIHTQVYLVRTEDKWPDRAKLDWGKETKTEATGLGWRTIRGRTVGMLGYGHIAREAARILKSMGCNIIAANSRGDQKPAEGYVVPGTGDPDGSLPSKYYSTTDPSSFSAFLKKTDILVASLPSTPATTYFLTKSHLDQLPSGAIFINIGRGTLIKSDELLAALDASPSQDRGLFAAAIDVTDPEPLPDHSPLFRHPRVIVTPHISGHYAGYADAIVDLLITSVEGMRKGEKPLNAVDPEKGY